MHETISKIINLPDLSIDEDDFINAYNILSEGAYYSFWNRKIASVKPWHDVFEEIICWNKYLMEACVIVLGKQIANDELIPLLEVFFPEDKDDVLQRMKDKLDLVQSFLLRGEFLFILNIYTCLVVRLDKNIPPLTKNFSPENIKLIINETYEINKIYLLKNTYEEYLQSLIPLIIKSDNKGLIKNKKDIEELAARLKSDHKPAIMSNALLVSLLEKFDAVAQLIKILSKQGISTTIRYAEFNTLLKELVQNQIINIDDDSLPGAINTNQNDTSLINGVIYSTGTTFSSLFFGASVEKRFLDATQEAMRYRKN